MVYGSLWQWEATTYQHKIFHGVHFRKNAVKCCKNAFLERGPLTKCSIDVKFYMDKLEQVYYIHTKFQISRSSGSLLKCCKMLQKCDFLYFFEHCSYRKCGIDAKFYMDKLEHVQCVHRKFQVPRISESPSIYCKMLQKCDFLTFQNIAPTKNATFALNFTWENQSK